jgi:lysophospholipase L1-like esterase
MKYNIQTIKASLEKGAIIKLIGDSITAGGGSSDNNRRGEVFITIDGIEFRRQLGQKCWAALLARYIEKKFPKSCVINNGCSNITSTHLKEKLLSLYNNIDEIILIMIGTNDRKHVDGMTVLYNNLSYIVSHLEHENKTVVLMSPNPSTAKNQAYPNRLYTMDDVNRVIKKVAEEQKVQVICHYDYIYSYLMNSGSTIEDLMVGKSEKLDGLHPSDEAHYLIYKNIIQSLSLEYSNG